MVSEMNMPIRLEALPQIDYRPETKISVLVLSVEAINQHVIRVSL